MFRSKLFILFNKPAAFVHNIDIFTSFFDLHLWIGSQGCFPIWVSRLVSQALVPRSGPKTSHGPLVWPNKRTSPLGHNVESLGHVTQNWSQGNGPYVESHCWVPSFGHNAVFHGWVPSYGLVLGFHCWSWFWVQIYSLNVGSQALVLSGLRLGVLGS